MPIILNDLLFQRNDRVDGSLDNPPLGLLVAAASAVDTDDGNDSLHGKADDSSPSLFEGAERFGVYLQNRLSMGAGNDSLIGEASTTTGASFVYGITLGFNNYTDASLNTGAGNDLIKGTASSTAESGFVYGICQFWGNDIDTGVGGPASGNRGNDSVIGEASGSAANLMAGLFLDFNSTLTTNEGNDTVRGTSMATNTPSLSAGILLYGGSTAGIYTGAGNDNVSAYATANNGQRINGFAGGGIIDLGADNDTLAGFGELIAHGGSGRDKWILSSYNSTDFTIVKGNTSQLQATFTGFGATATIDGIEEFVFANGSFSYANLA